MLRNNLMVFLLIIFTCTFVFAQESEFVTINNVQRFSHVSTISEDLINSANKKTESPLNMLTDFENRKSILKQSSANPVSKYLAELGYSDKNNAVIQLEVSTVASKSVQNIINSINLNWNSGNIEQALNKLKIFEQEYGENNIAIGIAWKTPKQTSFSGNIEAIDVRVGNRDNIYNVEIDQHPTSGNLFAVLQYSDVNSRYWWSVNISTDNGETWTTLLTNHGSDDIYVDNYGNIFSANNYYGLLRSTDMGTTWDTLSHNFVGERILVITGNSTNQLFCSAGTYGQFAVYMSDDIGENWIDVTSGFHSNRTVCTSLAFDSRGFIYAGTNYYSVFRSVLTTVGIGKGHSKLPSEYLLEQNYPNPFNPVTSIQYSLPYSGFVIITVYDMLGRKVAFLVNEEKPAGNYEVDFSAKGLASGVYIYRMKVNDPETGSGQDFIQSKKMMLIK